MVGREYFCYTGLDWTSLCDVGRSGSSVDELKCACWEAILNVLGDEGYTYSLV